MATIELLPGLLNLSLYRGDDENFMVTITEDGTPAVLPSTGWLAQIRAKATADSPVLAEIEIDTTDAGSGVLRFSLSGADTADLPKKSKWDLQCASPEVRTYLAGDVLMTEQVSQ